MEDVFLQVARSTAYAEDSDRMQQRAAQAQAAGQAGEGSLLQGQGQGQGQSDDPAGLEQEVEAALSPRSAGAAEGGEGGCAACGLNVARHTRAMFVKRLRYGLRDRKAQCCMVLLPVLLLCAGFALTLQLQGSLQTMPEVALSLHAHGPIRQQLAGFADQARPAATDFVPG